MDRVANRMGAIYAISLAMFSMASSAADLGVWSRFHNAKLVSTSEKLYEKMDLVSGDIDYVDDKGSEGYRPKSLVSMNAGFVQKVYDYPSTTSALLIYEDMRDALAKAGFQVVYQCESKQCGDVDAWRLYLSRRISGDLKTQKYLLAKHNARNGGELYVQLYVIDLGRNPRAVVSVVGEGVRPSLGLVINQSVLTANRFRATASLDLLSIKFGTESSELSQSSRNQLINIAKEIRERKISSVDISGYTDSKGSSDVNLSLSKSRAEAVVKALKGLPGMEAVEMSIRGQGPENPKADNMTADGRAENRRVDINLRSRQSVSSQQVPAKLSMQ